MSNKKKFKKNKLKSEILAIFRDNPTRAFNYKQITGFLEISDKNIRQSVYELMKEEAKSGSLIEVQRGKFKVGKIKETLEGIIEMTRRGAGYFISEALDTDIYIPPKFTDKAIHGDKVEVEIKPGRGKRSRPEGAVVKVIGRENRTFVGTLELQEKYAFLIPDDPRINIDIYIPLDKTKGGQHGFKAIAKITDWPETAKSPFGEIIDVLGRPESNDAEMKAVLTAYGIKYEFPEEVRDEANSVMVELPEEEIKKRRDFRDILTITIDPVDARDFDDALSIEFLEDDKFRVGVHIADVGHYVPEGSALDIEAQDRGNSVYLVDRVIPMLPEHLSNMVCSLRPDEEKFTFSAVFDLDINGKVLKEWFGKTVIRSDRRYTYEEAQEVIETGKGDYYEEVLKMDEIAKNLRTKRISKGALEVQGSEIRFELDSEGMPVNVYKKITKDANKLIEEFMLLANKRVGRFVGNVRKGKMPPPFVYRIHDKPDMEKVDQFRMFMAKFGREFRFKDERDISRQMNTLFKEFEGEGEHAMIQQMAIKSMAKAVYDVENIGHYGLAFSYYAHFTSPIRRYADLMVHRILLETLTGKPKHRPGLSETTRHISVTERGAVEAERASKKYFQAKYLEDKVGEIFKGSITGLTEWGIYVEMEANYCEGMVSMKSFKDDRYHFDEKEYVVIGSNTGNEYNIGDSVYVEIVKVSLARKQIDLEIVE